MTEEEVANLLAKNGIRPLSQKELEARRSHRDAIEESRRLSRESGRTSHPKIVAARDNEPINDYDAGRVWPVTQLVVGIAALVAAAAVLILGPLLVAMWVWERLS